MPELEFKSLVDNILIASAIAVMLSAEVIFNKLFKTLDVIESVTIIPPSLPQEQLPPQRLQVCFD